jgi:hypothetical protein
MSIAINIRRNHPFAIITFVIGEKGTNFAHILLKITQNIESW